MMSVISDHKMDFVFHMHAQVAIEYLFQLANYSYLVDPIYIKAIDVLKILHE